MVSSDDMSKLRDYIHNQTPDFVEPVVEKWVHFFGPVNGKTKVDSFIGYAAHLGLIRGGTPSGLYC